MNAGTGYSSSEESRVEWNGSISLKNEVEDIACFFPETINPTVKLKKDLEELNIFLKHQIERYGSNKKEVDDLMNSSEKELASKIRELENWNFRLHLDEAKEIQGGLSSGILSNPHFK